MNGNRPCVSIGMPVYNGEQTLPKALDTLLGQTFEDFEIVISDNASEDRTEAVCRQYAREDKRIRYYRNESNIGQIANFNRVFQLSSGEYFRWMGCDDWWARGCIERCVRALDDNPWAIGVTCYHKYYNDEGKEFYEEYKGPRVDSVRAHRRFDRMLWFLRANPYYLDPIYSMVRRSALLETKLLRMMPTTDAVLAAELSLVGAFYHVSECLVFHRLGAPTRGGEWLRRCDLKQSDAKWWFAKTCWVMGSVVACRPLTRLEKMCCFWSLAKYFAGLKWRRFCWWCRKVVALRSRYRAVRGLLRGATGWGIRSDG